VRVFARLVHIVTIVTFCSTMLIVVVYIFNRGRILPELNWDTSAVTSMCVYLVFQTIDVVLIVRRSRSRARDAGTR